MKTDKENKKNSAEGFYEVCKNNIPEEEMPYLITCKHFKNCPYKDMDAIPPNNNS
ncbi:hypothetical protein LJC57_01320 [Parabacteroides sp. OttesenSCG-928-G07]|nr:hypothetical protein [Parabacteroides sp. OttesenSCG-928-G07]